MNIVVCIKQVIAGNKVRIDPQSHTLIRSADSSEINPYDLYALSMAVELKNKYSGFITVLTMGPKISEEVLWEALARGADRAILLNDERFSGSDTLATSYVLAMGIRKIGSYEVILCGIRTTDSDTGQVGPQLAEELGIPHVTGVEHIEKLDKVFRVERKTDGFKETLDVSKPALFTIFPHHKAPLPNLIEIQEAFHRYRIEYWNLEDLQADPKKVGISGSLTRVEELTPLVREKSCRFIEGDPKEQAKTLFLKLKEKNLFS